MDDAEANMSDYRLVIMAEDGGGDAQYWSSPLSVRVNDLMHSMQLNFILWHIK